MKKDKVGIPYPLHLILVVSDVLPEHPVPLQPSVHHITVAIILVISGHEKNSRGSVSSSVSGAGPSDSLDMQI